MFEPGPHWATLVADARVTHAAGASAERVREAEKHVGVALPEDYAWFLRTYGWMQVRNEYIHGLGDDVPQGYDLIDQFGWAKNWEKHLSCIRGVIDLPLWELGNGDWIGYVLRDGRWSIEQIHHELDEAEAVAESFDAWVAAIAKRPTLYFFEDTPWPLPRK